MGLLERMAITAASHPFSYLNSYFTKNIVFRIAAPTFNSAETMS